MVNTKIKKLRKERNMTQKDLANAMGVSTAIISRYESGFSFPRKKCLQKLSDVLKVPVSELLVDNFQSQENNKPKEPSVPDFDMIKQIYDKDKFCPENKGFLTGEETKYLSSTLELESRTILSLRNLRNFVVSYHYGKLVTDKNSDQDTYKMSDLLSAITGVIDSKIFELGGMV